MSVLAVVGFHNAEEAMQLEEILDKMNNKSNKTCLNLTLEFVLG